MSLVTAKNNDLSLGVWRLGALGDMPSEPFSSTLIDAPPTLADPHGYQVPGTTQGQAMTFRMSRDDVVDDMRTAQDNRTAYPLAKFVRGAAGGYCELYENVRITGIPNPADLGAWIVREITLAPGDQSIQRVLGGVLFDHTIAHPNGVTATADGTSVQLGAVSATQVLALLFLNLHHPAPTVVGGGAKVRSAADSIMTTPNDRGSAWSSVSSTPSYVYQEVSGPITDTWYQFQITAITSGTWYPVCLAWKF